GRTAFWPTVGGTRSSCPQLPTTLPTFDELLGRDGVEEPTIAEAVFRISQENAASNRLQVFTLHAELEGMLLLDAFESLLRKWQSAGAMITGMARIHELALQASLPDQTVVMGEVPG